MTGMWLRGCPAGYSRTAVNGRMLYAGAEIRFWARGTLTTALLSARDLSYTYPGASTPALRVKEALDDVGLAGFEKRNVNELSAGEKQRLGMAFRPERGLVWDAGLCAGTTRIGLDVHQEDRLPPSCRRSPSLRHLLIQATVCHRRPGFASQRLHDCF